MASMSVVLTVVEVVSALITMMAVLLQHRGTGIGGAFGGEDLSYRSRRGIERFLFRLTIVMGTIFLISAIAQLLI